MIFSCQNVELSHPKRKLKNKRKKIHQKHPSDEFDDPYEADDESEGSSSNIDRRSINNANNLNRLVLKVVKQGDYRHKQSFNADDGLGDIEQDNFLPTLASAGAGEMVKSGRRRRKNENFVEDADYDIYDEFVKASKKAVFEVPRKPLPNYSKWSRWSKCTPKCITRRFKKCRPYARHICGNDVIREIAYCYTEGSFCEKWINEQMSKIDQAPIKTTTTRRTTTKSTTRTPKTESPLMNAVSQNFQRPMGGKRRKSKQNNEIKTQNFQCGFPSIRNKNSDFLLKIIGGRTARRGQVRLENISCLLNVQLSHFIHTVALASCNFESLQGTFLRWNARESSMGSDRYYLLFELSRLSSDNLYSNYSSYFNSKSLRT